MERKALTTRNVAGWSEKAEQHRVAAKAKADLREKTFEDLTDLERSGLLKTVAIRLGLIKAS